MACVGLDLWELSQQFAVVFLQLAVDAAPINGLVFDMLVDVPALVCFLLG